MCFATTITGFAIVSNNVAKAEKLGYYKQTLVYNQAEHILEGKEVVGFYNYTNDVLNNVCLHLYPNAFRESSRAKVVSLANQDKAYPNGKSYGNIEIESVCFEQDYANYEVCGLDQNILKIELNEQLFPNETVEFEIGFSVKLANINHRLGYGKNTINICNYYPIMCVYENGDFVCDLYHSNGDPFYSKTANYEVSISYSSNLTLASTGKQKNVLDGDIITTTISAQNVRDFAMVLSNNFEQISENYEGVEINYYYYGEKTPK